MQQKWNQNFDGEPMTDIPQKFLNAGCDVYMVMQLRHDEKIFDERFASMRELNRRGKTPDPEHYEITYYADLPTGGQFFQHDGVQPRPRRVQGGGVAARAAAHHEHIINMIVVHI